MKLKARASLAIVLLLTLVPPYTLAQTVAVAELDGAVLDATGAIISGATLVATNADTAAMRTTTTNGAGEFTMPSLAVGPYSVEIQAKGFRSFQQTGIILQVGSSSMIKAVLDVGSPNDTITVQSDAQMIETRNVAISTAIDNREINDLPLDGRLATQLVLIAGACILQWRQHVRFHAWEAERLRSKRTTGDSQSADATWSLCTRHVPCIK